MGMPVKRSRLIRFDGRSYRWLIKERYDLCLRVQDEAVSGPILCVNFGYRVETGPVSVTPRVVRELIELALQQGWNPRASRPREFGLHYTSEVRAVLESAQLDSPGELEVLETGGERVRVTALGEATLPVFRPLPMPEEPFLRVGQEMRVYFGSSFPGSRSWNEFLKGFKLNRCRRRISVEPHPSPDKLNKGKSRFYWHPIEEIGFELWSSKPWSFYLGGERSFWVSALAVELNSFQLARLRMLEFVAAALSLGFPILNQACLQAGLIPQLDVEREVSDS